jgi:hypothetical protein
MQNKWDLMLMEMKVSTTSKLCIILCLPFLFEVWPHYWPYWNQLSLVQKNDSFKIVYPDFEELVIISSFLQKNLSQDFNFISSYSLWLCYLLHSIFFIGECCWLKGFLVSYFGLQDLLVQPSSWQWDLLGNGLVCA